MSDRFAEVMGKRSQLPPGTECHYVHGAVRGASEVRQSKGFAAQLLALVEQPCKDAAHRGLAINLEKAYRQNGAQVEAQLEDLDESDAAGIRGWLEAFERDPSLHVTPMWQLERRQ